MINRQKAFVLATLVLGVFAFLGSLAPVKAAQGFTPFQVSSSVAAPTCATSILDTYPASPGAYTAVGSLRKTRAAYAGNAIQLTNSNGGAATDIGFNGCDPDTVVPASYCTTTTLAVATASTRTTFPAGTTVHIYNAGAIGFFWTAGNSSVVATTSSNVLASHQGVNLTIGANTNIAALIGTGYDINGVNSSSLFMTNCFVTKIYDQSIAGGQDATPITASFIDEMGYIPSAQGSLPLLSGCLANCGMKLADSATYKTTVVETFAVMSFGEDVTTSNFNYNGVGYPTTTSANAANQRWGMANTGNADTLTNNMNGSSLANAEGLGGIFRAQNLGQYDYSSSTGVTTFNARTFMTTGSGTPTYPNAVGMYIMGDAAGNGTPGNLAEYIVASGNQTTNRIAISANQISYWGITVGNAITAALTNPLGDGFNWNRIQIGTFASFGTTFTVNGNAFSSEGAWNNWSQYSCTNCSTASGQLGDLWRFTNTLYDNWDGTDRSELDGSGNAQFNNGVSYWLSYAMWIEPGTTYANSWNIIGQMHAQGVVNICCVFNFKLPNGDNFQVNSDNTSTLAETQQYLSPSPVARGRWIHVVVNTTVSTSGTADVFKVWVDPVTAGTMTQVVNLTGATLFGGNGGGSTYSYWKYGNYRGAGQLIAPTLSVRYGNMQVCSAGADCTAKYGVTDLSANAVTPLADPAHLFLLKRDLDPASNDNTPLFLNKAA